MNFDDFLRAHKERVEELNQRQQADRDRIRFEFGGFSGGINSSWFVDDDYKQAKSDAKEVISTAIVTYDFGQLTRIKDAVITQIKLRYMKEFGSGKLTNKQAATIMKAMTHAFDTLATKLEAIDDH